jgi:hypothetical protein
MYLSSCHQNMLSALLRIINNTIHNFKQGYLFKKEKLFWAIPSTFTVILVLFPFCMITIIISFSFQYFYNHYYFPYFVINQGSFTLFVICVPHKIMSKYMRPWLDCGSKGTFQCHSGSINKVYQSININI